MRADWLRWTNKHLRLLAHEDGSYEWVEPSDYRVAEAADGTSAALRPRRVPKQWTVRPSRNGALRN